MSFLHNKDCVILMRNGIMYRCDMVHSIVLEQHR